MNPLPLDSIISLHARDRDLPPEWARLIRACRRGHLGEALDAAGMLDDPIAGQLAADVMLMHGRPDLAAPRYHGLLGDLPEGFDGQEITLRARLGLAAVALQTGDVETAAAHAAAAMGACFALAVHDDTMATGYCLFDYGEYLGEYPLHAAARSLAELPQLDPALRARLLHFLFLAGGCEDKALLDESFAVLQAPEQLFWVAQEQYRAGDVATALELELRHAAYVREHGGFPDLCCAAIGEEPTHGWAGQVDPAAGERLLDLAIPLALGSSDPHLVQGITPFFATGGVQLMRRAGRNADVVAVVDLLDKHKPEHACAMRARVVDLRREKRAALKTMREGGAA